MAARSETTRGSYFAVEPICDLMQERKAAAKAAKQRNVQRLKDNKAARDPHQAATVPAKQGHNKSARGTTTASPLPSGERHQGQSSTAANAAGLQGSQKRKRVNAAAPKPAAAKNAKFETFLGDLVVRFPLHVAVSTECQHENKYTDFDSRLEMRHSQMV